MSRLPRTAPTGPASALLRLGACVGLFALLAAPTLPIGSEMAIGRSNDLAAMPVSLARELGNLTVQPSALVTKGDVWQLVGGLKAIAAPHMGIVMGVEVHALITGGLDPHLFDPRHLRTKLFSQPAR